MASRVARWAQKRAARSTPLCAKVMNRAAGGSLLGIDWRPHPGPQRLALESEADEIFYGGAAGGGKSDLGIGAALLHHRHSIFFRLEFAQCGDAIARTKEIVADYGAYNGQEKTFSLPGGRSLKFGGCPRLANVKKWFGRARDLIIFDEAPTFPEETVVTIAGWNRSATPGQRCRVILTGNPPTDEEGRWIVRRYAAWLDKKHPNPAKPGELRWFARLKNDQGDDVDTEVPGPEPIEVTEGGVTEKIYPKSRTFIPALLADNPSLAGSGYERMIDAMPEPLRSQLKRGDFGIGRIDSEWQVIPTAWIEAAQARWKPDGAGTHHLNALGVDVARGGKDKTVIVERRGNWLGLPSVHPGSDTPDGPAVAALVSARYAKPAWVKVDLIGVGTSVYDILVAEKLPTVGVNVGAGTEERDKTGYFRFKNIRALLWWRLREMLDPEAGLNLALPPGDQVLGDLVAPHWKLVTGGIQIESKEDIHKRIGRSPDIGDAICLAADMTLGMARTDDELYTQFRKLIERQEEADREEDFDA